MEAVSPYIVIDDNNKFIFCFSYISSYLPLGKYEQNDNEIILNSDNNEKYVFTIDKDKLIFNKDKSSDLKIGGNDTIKDRAVFKLEYVD